MNSLTTRRIATLSRGLFGLLALVVFIWITGPDATAQEIQHIGFNDAVQIALDRSVTIRRAQNNVELQVATVAAEKAAFLPNLNFSSGTSRNYGLSFDQTAGELVNESTDSFNMGASSSLNIFNGFADVASLAEARMNLEAQEYDYDRTRQTIVLLADIPFHATTAPGGTGDNQRRCLPRAGRAAKMHTTAFGFGQV